MRSSRAHDFTDTLGHFVESWNMGSAGHQSLATTQKYLEPSKETEKRLEDLKLSF